jgi:hypothetical protein
MIDVEELLLIIENKQVELEYSSTFRDKEDLEKKKSQIEILDWLVEEICDFSRESFRKIYKILSGK